MVSVYLAARYSEKDEINQVADMFRSRGISVTSSWLDESHDPKSSMADIPTDFLKVYAETDIRDIDSADWFVFHSVDPDVATVRGGRHVEFGYALAKRKKILVVGPKENIFHHISGIEHTDCWIEASKIVKENQ